jgi:thioredoxin-like negative regulator of GroEL
MYRLLARLRGIGPRSVARIDLGEIGVSPQAGLVVQFTHPRCSDCRTLEERLSAQGVPLALVDVTRHPDLARKYNISLVPLAFKVDTDGKVLARV